MSFSESLRRAPAVVLLAVSLVLFAASAVIFALPFEATAPDGATVECGPPMFEVVASDNARPSITVPNTGTSTSTSTTSTTINPFLALLGSSTSTPPPKPTTPPSTVDLYAVTKEVCGSPASTRLFLGGAGMVVAIALGYGARLLARRTPPGPAIGPPDDP